MLNHLVETNSKVQQEPWAQEMALSNQRLWFLISMKKMMLKERELIIGLMGL